VILPPSSIAISAEVIGANVPSEYWKIRDRDLIAKLVKVDLVRLYRDQEVQVAEARGEL
jgi:hypothetical protein